MKIKFWGVRGSIPTPGPDTVRYGGNTSCVQITGSQNQCIILDAGSGIRNLGIDLLKTKQFDSKGKPVRLLLHLFLSHVHWDHIQGIPFFKPLFIKGNEIDIHGENKILNNLEYVIKKQQAYPNFPITIEEIINNGTNITFIDMASAGYRRIDDYIIVSYTKLTHPDGVLCYKIEEIIDGKSVVYATDTEHRNILDPRLLKLAQGADVLIYDAQYTPDEYSGKKDGIPKFDWGHSTYEFAVDTAIEAGVKQLFLFHHDPEHTDKDIDSIVAFARNRAYNKLMNSERSVDDLIIEAAMEDAEIII